MTIRHQINGLVMLCLAAAITACTPETSSTQGKNRLDAYPPDVEQLTQAQMNEILKYKYNRLNEQDQALWIAVYAAEFKDGFEKSQKANIDAGFGPLVEMPLSSGDSQTDTVTIHMRYMTDDVFVELMYNLPRLTCSQSALRWATSQGVLLKQTYLDMDGEKLFEFIMSEESCEGL